MGYFTTFRVLRPLRHLARSLVFLDLLCRRLKSIRRMPQKDDAQHGHKVVAGGELRVSPEIIRGSTEVRFEFFYIFETVSHESRGPDLR